MKLNHEILLNNIASKIPTYFMRYEDLRMNPKPALEGLFCFLLDVPSIKGTVVERRIEDVIQPGSPQKSTYRLKSTSSSLSR